MSGLRSTILRGVAYPPTMLFVPFELTGMNVAFNITLMLICLVIFDLTPIIWIISLVVTQVFLIVMASRDAHIVTVLRAIGSFKKTSKNIVPTDEGVKYVP